MPIYTQTQMCSECPFRAIAPAGWLGPATPEEVNACVHNEGVYICHVNIDKMQAAGVPEEEWEEQGQHCVGFLRYRTSIFKRGRDWEQSQAQDRLKELPDKPLIPPFKFLAHHNPQPKKKRKK